MAGLTGDTGKHAKNRAAFCTGSAWHGFGGVGRRPLVGELLPVEVERLVIFGGGHGCRYQFAFDACNTPGLCGHLDDLANTGQHQIETAGVREVADVVDDLVHDDSSCNVDGLLSVGRGVSCFEGLLSPECFTTNGLATDVGGEHLEESVGFVEASAKGEEEGLEHAIGQGLGDDMLDVCSTKLAACGSVVDEVWHIRRDLGQDVRWWLDWEVVRVFFRDCDDDVGELGETSAAIIARQMISDGSWND